MGRARGVPWGALGVPAAPRAERSRVVRPGRVGEGRFLTRVLLLRAQGGSGEGQGWRGWLCPHSGGTRPGFLRGQTRSVLFQRGLTIPPLCGRSAGTGTKPRAGVNSPAPTADLNTPRAGGDPGRDMGTRAAGGLRLDGTGGGAGTGPGAWIRPQLSLLTLRARMRTAGSSQAARYQTSTKEANGSSP